MYSILIIIIFIKNKAERFVSKQLSKSPVPIIDNTKHLDKKNEYQNYTPKDQEEKDLNDYVLINRPNTKENTKLTEQFTNMNLDPTTHGRTSSSTNINNGIATLKANSENSLDLIPVPTQVENYKIMERKFSRTTTTPAAILINNNYSNNQTPLRPNEQSQSENCTPPPIIHKFSLKNNNGLNFPQLDIGDPSNYKIGLDVLNTPKTNQLFVDELEEETLLDVRIFLTFIYWTEFL